MPNPPNSNPPWEELVAWAESDLRRQLQFELPRGGLVSVTGILGTTLRRAASKPDRLRGSLQDAKNYIRGIATNARREKVRNAVAQKRQPANGTVLSMGDGMEPASNFDSEALEIWEAVDRLSAEFSALLRALFIDGCSQKEYAELHRLSPKQVERNYHRAIDCLEGALGQHFQ
jgi:DNA-directed RNA polymerase specialized sigma24 family protein